MLIRKDFGGPGHTKEKDLNLELPWPLKSNSATLNTDYITVFAQSVRNYARIFER